MHPALLTAYRKTSYEANGIEVRIGRRSPAMDNLLASHGVREAAFITAYNPFSRVMPPGWNQRMQARLLQALRRRRVLPANGSWRRWSEAHLMVLGDVRQVHRLVGSFRQNAIVIVRRGQPAHLRLAPRLTDLAGSTRSRCPVTPSGAGRRSEPGGQRTKPTPVAAGR